MASFCPYTTPEHTPPSSPIKNDDPLTLTNSSVESTIGQALVERNQALIDAFQSSGLISVSLAKLITGQTTEEISACRKTIDEIAKSHGTYLSLFYSMDMLSRNLYQYLVASCFEQDASKVIYYWSYFAYPIPKDAFNYLQRKVFTEATPDNLEARRTLWQAIDRVTTDYQLSDDFYIVKPIKSKVHHY